MKMRGAVLDKSRDDTLESVPIYKSISGTERSQPAFLYNLKPA